MKKIETNNKVELFAKVKEVITFIETDYVSDEKYQVNDSLNSIKSLNMMKSIQDFGVRDTKRLKRILNNVIKKNSLRSINILLNFLSVNVYVKPIRISEPKHIEIQKLRKDWKDAHTGKISQKEGIDRLYPFKDVWKFEVIPWGWYSDKQVKN